ncbi:MAG: shikimate dehydrogenase [Chloroflexi bacterium]|nr:shikimate dehydrogenase [Chloroflexota bacterium]MCY4246218.1 shikimate dehydrogenase [Chloroflexota bacterium]
MTTAAQLLFIGVSTGASSIRRIFPRWMRLLGVDAELVGVDLPLRAPAAAYRDIAARILDDGRIKGALITAHKIDMLHACHDQFAWLDAYAEICAEVSCLVKRDGRLLGYAKDPLSSALALRQFVPERHWNGERDALCLGAGGAAVAISVCLAQRSADQGAPRRLVLTDVLPERLDSIRQVHARLDTPLRFSYRLCHSATDNDALLRDMPAGSLVINATGLGKDAPGSPLTDDARFPQGGLVWELNYRGERDFMRQANAQADQKQLHVEDGWAYFLYGWAEMVAEVFGLALDDALFARLAAAAESL